MLPSTDAGRRLHARDTTPRFSHHNRGRNCQAGHAFFSFLHHRRGFSARDLSGKVLTSSTADFSHLFFLYCTCYCLSAPASLLVSDVPSLLFPCCRCKSVVAFLRTPHERLADHPPSPAFRLEQIITATCLSSQTLTYTVLLSTAGPPLLDRPYPTPGRPLRNRSDRTPRSRTLHGPQPLPCSTLFYFLFTSMDIKWRPLLHPTVG